jgi:hypothetical protein
MSQEFDRSQGGPVPGFWFDGFRARKPPIGVMPRNIHRERRRDELLRALSEYLRGGYVNDLNRATVFEWVDELREMVESEGK